MGFRSNTNNALPTGSAGGDLGGSYPNPSVAQLEGSIVLSGTPSSGQVLTATSSSAAHWAAGGGVPAGSTKDVQFNTGGSFDADTGKFVWDKTNHRIGIGQSTPTKGLHVTTSGGDTQALIESSDSTGVLRINSGGGDQAAGAFVYLEDNGTLKWQIGNNPNTGIGGVVDTFHITDQVNATQPFFITHADDFVQMPFGAKIGGTLNFTGSKPIIGTTATPASNGTGTTGMFTWDGSFLYICISTNTWARVAVTGGY